MASNNPSDFLPFPGKIERSQIKDSPRGARIDIDRRPGPQAGVRFKIGPRELPNSIEEREIFALVAHLGPGGEAPSVTFRHPFDPKRIVHVELRDDREGVDGVWVAEEDGKGDDEKPRR